MAFDAESATGQVQEFLGILSKRRWQVGLPALFILSLGIVYAVIVPKKFVVSTRVEIRESRVEEDYQLRNPQETATARELVNAEHHIKHYSRVLGIIEEQGDLWGEFIKLDPPQRPRFVHKVLDNIDVLVESKVRPVGSTFVDIEYSDVNGERAERFLSRLTELWIAEVIERDRNNLRDERDVLQNQVEDARREWTELNQKYTDLCKQMGIDPLLPLDDRPQDAYFEELDDLRDRKEEVETELTEARTELESLRNSLEEMPLEVGMPESVGGVRFDDVIAGMETKILDLRRQQGHLTPLHSKYRQIESDVRELEDRIEEARALERDAQVTLRWVPNPRRAELDGDIVKKGAFVEGLRSRVDNLGQRIDAKRAETRKRAEDYRDLAALYEERQRARDAWSLKGSQLERKRSALEVMVEAWADPFEVVEQPQAGEGPTKPNPALLAAFAGIAGLSIGLGIGLLAEYGRDAYRTVSDVSQVMSVPVLGTINVIRTAAEARRNRLRRLMVGSSSAVIVGGLLWFSWIWSYQPDRLPVEVIQAIESFRFKLM